MKCLLHIGLEKTGTTAIQRFLSTNRASLARKGILYPSSPGVENHIALTAYARDDEAHDDVRIAYNVCTTKQVESFRRSFRESFSAEVSSSSSEICILSGEHCSSRLQEGSEVARLCELLSMLFEHTTVLAYFRRQDEFLLSSYSTAVKSGETRRCEVPSQSEIDRRYVYDRLLDRWATIFGKQNIKARRYQEDALMKADIIDDFVSVIDPNKFENLPRPRRLNESLDVVTLEFLRMFNRHEPYITDGKFNSFRGEIVEILQSASNGPLVTIEPEKLGNFMESFADSNRRAAIEYFEGPPLNEGDPLFGKASGRCNRKQMSNLTPEKIMEVAALIWREQQYEIRELRQQLQVLGKSED